VIKVFCLAKTHKLGWLAIHTYSGTEGCFTLFAACLLGLVPVRPVKMAMELMKISNQYKQQLILQSTQSLLTVTGSSMLLLMLLWHDCSSVAAGMQIIT